MIVLLVEDSAFDAQMALAQWFDLTLTKEQLVFLAYVATQILHYVLPDGADWVRRSHADVR